MVDKKIVKYKYSYHDLKTDRSKPLPDDINDALRLNVKPLNGDELIATIDMIQKKRLFGDVFVYGHNGFLITKINFQSGMCKKFDIIHNVESNVIVRPLHIVFLRSERNSMISFRGNKEEEEV